MKGVITTVQRMSIHDGPGIRSTVFLKGCNFRCRWCHNPETWSSVQQLQQISTKCILCGDCIEVCAKGALSLHDNIVEVDRARCVSCGACASVCMAGALSVIGKYIDVDQLTKELSMDMPYYVESGGGVTVSGGEPFMQFEFVRELLLSCKSKKIHTAVETNLCTTAERLLALIPYVDLWMVDLKIADDELHREQTGMSNRQTIANLALLGSHRVQIIVRTPIIPNINDSEQHIEAICRELSRLDILKYELLPFHSLGFDKFIQFGLDNPMVESSDLDKERLVALRSIVNKYGLNK